MPSTDKSVPASESASVDRTAWSAPQVRRLALSEAEFNPIIATDGEGTS